MMSVLSVSPVTDSNMSFFTLFNYLPFLTTITALHKHSDIATVPSIGEYRLFCSVTGRRDRGAQRHQGGSETCIFQFRVLLRQWLNNPGRI